MSKRFGRNQRRKLRDQVEQANRAAQYWCGEASMARAAEALCKRQLSASFAWPAQKWVPSGEGQKMNPDRVGNVAKFINQELTIGEQANLIQSLQKGVMYGGEEEEERGDGICRCKDAYGKSPRADCPYCDGTNVVGGKRAD